MAICMALKSSNINLPEGRVISSLAYKMQNKGQDNLSLALKVLSNKNSFYVLPSDTGADLTFPFGGISLAKIALIVDVI